MESWTVHIYVLLFLVFLFAGTIKGVIGLGFPTIIVAILSVVLGLREAMALMLIPCFATNIWQALRGGHLRMILQRLWPMLLCIILFTWLTTSIVADIRVELLSCLLGAMILFYGLSGLFKARCHSSGRHEIWLSPIIGIINGIITGLTGTFVVPAIFYLHSLKFTSDILVQAMGVLFLISTTALAAGLSSHDLLPKEFFYISIAALIPSLIGMEMGQRLRRNISEKKFQQLFYASLLLLGVYIISHCLY